jgi:hypothetical protein
MKVLLYGLPRTRSTYLTDILSQHYNLQNYFEPYHKAITESIDNSYDINQRDEKWQAYLIRCQEITNKLKIKDNFILKIFPEAIYNVPQIQNRQFLPSQSDLVPFIEFYNIGMYDQIYVTYRENKTDWLCSLLYAKNHDAFLFTNTNKAKFYAPKKIKLEYNIPLEFFAFNELMYEYGLRILKHYTTNVVELEYNEIPNYIKRNFSEIKSDLVDTQYDYKNNILNYEQIKIDYEKVTNNNIMLRAKDFLESLLP